MGVREMQRRAAKAKARVKVSRRAADRAWKRSVSAERGLKKHKHTMARKERERAAQKRKATRRVDGIISASRARGKASRGGNSERLASFLEMAESADEFQPDMEMLESVADDFDADYEEHVARFPVQQEEVDVDEDEDEF